MCTVVSKFLLTSATWLALTIAFSLPTFDQQTVLFSGDGREWTYGTCTQCLPHVGWTGTLLPAICTWVAYTHPHRHTSFQSTLPSMILLIVHARALWPALQYFTLVAWTHSFIVTWNSIPSSCIWILPFTFWVTYPLPFVVDAPWVLWKLVLHVNARK